VESVFPVHQAQLLTYMRLSGKSVGLLLNFHESKMKDGITVLFFDRFIYNFALYFSVFLSVLRASVVKFFKD
jgi:hypothetical protein